MLDTLAPDAVKPPQVAPLVVSLEDEITDPIESLDTETVGLDSEILDVLGADPSKPLNTQISIQSDVEARWSFWLASSLKKEELDSLMEQYPRSSTKCLFEAPRLNPEIASISTEALIQRDKKFCASQNLSGSALVALGAAISSLISEEEVDKLTLLKNLCDAGKMMTQVHQGFSTTRRAFISPSLNKQVRSTLEATTPDQLLYGSNLSEKVKEVKTMSKLGQDLRVTPPTPAKKTSYLNSKSSFVKFKNQTGQKPRIPPKSNNNFHGRRQFSKRPNNPQSTSTTPGTANNQENKK